MWRQLLLLQASSNERVQRRPRGSRHQVTRYCQNQLRPSRDKIAISSSKPTRSNKRLPTARQLAGSQWDSNGRSREECQLAGQQLLEVAHNCNCTRHQITNRKRQEAKDSGISSEYSPLQPSSSLLWLGNRVQSDASAAGKAAPKSISRPTSWRLQASAAANRSISAAEAARKSAPCGRVRLG